MKVKEMFTPKSKGTEHTNFLHIYFLFSYYIGFTPFRFKYDSHQSNFILYTWYPQKILCAMIHLGILLRYALEIKKLHYSLKHSDPITYFRLIEVSSSFLCKLIAVHNFWIKKNVLLKIIQLLETASFPKFNPYKVQRTTFLSIVCIFYIFVSIFRLLFDPNFVGSSSILTKSWYKRMIIESRYSYVLGTENFEPPHESVSAWTNCLAILTAINIQFRIIAGFYLDLFILFNVLSLWAPVLGYVDTLEESYEIQKREEFKNFFTQTEERKHVLLKIDENVVTRQFKQLKHLSELICEAIGGFLLPAISEIAFGYAIDFEETLLTPNTMRRFTNILFLISTSLTFIFSAETCRKMTHVKTWLSQNEGELKVSRNELMMILDNISHDGISINAGGRVTINYSFVGTMVIVLVTFFIIRLQTESTRSFKI